MIIRVLGCSGAIAQGCRTTSFLLDQSVLIDAGTGVGDLSLSELAAIDHILISHSHLDHVLSIALLADSVMRQRLARGAKPVNVYALPRTLQALQEHIFNGVIWPDFTRLPSPEAPALCLHPFEVGEVLQIAGRTVEVLSAEHIVPAVGFAVHGSAGVWVYTGDTGPNPALWEQLRHMSVSHLVIEVAFSDEDRELARISQHLCPAELGRELKHLAGSVEVYITHIKPGEESAVMSAVARLGTPHRIRALAAGQEMHII